MPDKATILAWEQRWARPAAFASFGAILFIVAAILVAQGIGSGDGESEVLRNLQEHRDARLISGILQALGLGLLAIPLFALFHAANARSEKMRGQFVGVVIAGPVFLAIAAFLSSVSFLHAASEFVTHEVPRLTAKGVALSGDRANEAAKDAISNTPLQPLGTGFGFGGAIGFLVAMIYTALYAMRTGLLTRFWGSLGIALGAISFVPQFFPFTLLWFVYLGLLLAGWVPGGKPPAWESGEAEPWPTPGERMAGGDETESDE